MTLVLPLNQQWNFRRIDPSGSPVNWCTVDLPHTPFEPDLDGRDHWFGLSEYERTIQLPADAPAGACWLHIGAAMHTAVVLIDGREAGRHEGGYLPFAVDLTAVLADRGPHSLLLRLDNRDNPDVPPGKPYTDLDFCWYGGLYRDAALRCHPPVHITDPVAANEIAGGGVFVRTLALDGVAARIGVRVHVRNASAAHGAFAVEVELMRGAEPVAQPARSPLGLAAGAAGHIDFEIEVPRARLWAPDSPELHHARVILRGADGSPLDEASVRFGIRRIGFSRSAGFVINSRRLRLRGTNRHQEYPHSGYAVPPAAQRRDARRIKEAGFDYVRLSHYPQAPEFLDACDELGIVVMNAIPGWQFLGGESFREACYENARAIIRRDRNHPSVVLWELSLNETEMDEAFMARLRAIGHEEYPGGQMFTCGWQDCYDVYLHSRQHGEIHRWRNGDMALVVAEYGDWEFYAANQGFDQKTGTGVFASWSHSRQRRRDGERGLRQQVHNHIVALNDTLGSPAVLDGQWSMFDYARGYDPHRAACGIMDVHRLPKFSYYFYRSQRDPSEGGGAAWTGGPVVFIASHWVPGSSLRVLVFSNCESVELQLNERIVGRQGPSVAWMTQNLPHAPFVFDLPEFIPGTLEATAFIGVRAVAVHRVSTAGSPSRLELTVDTAGVSAAASEPDVLIAHARVLDSRHMPCVGDASRVQFEVDGPVKFAGPSAVETEAGIASVVLRVPAGVGEFSLRATRLGAEGVFAVSHLWSRVAEEIRIAEAV